MTFAIGCRKDDKKGQLLDVLHIFEYLSFDLEKECVNVCGDFLIYNNSNRPARLYVLHRGNIDFQLATDGWLEDKVYTWLLDEIAGKGIGLGESEGEIVLRRVANSPLEVKLLPDSSALEEWCPERPGDGTYVPCTGFKSPELEPQKCYLFRVIGTIEGESYKHLMPEPGSNSSIELMGGKLLWEEIKSEIEKLPPEILERYRRVYMGFEQTLIHPGFHSFFLEFADGSPLNIYHTTDIRGARINAEIGGRKVSWLWADSDLLVYNDGYGPKISLKKEHVYKPSPRPVI